MPIAIPIIPFRVGCFWIDSQGEIAVKKIPEDMDGIPKGRDHAKNRLGFDINQVVVEEVKSSIPQKGSQLSWDGSSVAILS